MLNRESGIGFVAKLPEVGSEAGASMQLSPQFEKQQVEFIYSAETNEGGLSIFFTDKAIKASSKLTMRNFSIVEIESP